MQTEQFNLFTQPPRPPITWAGQVPRQWQAAALPLAVASIADGERGLISAVMGSGKSILLARLCYLHLPAAGMCIVVTTPTIRLVEQLADTIALHCGSANVGKYYTKAKQIARVIICCNASAETLAADLAARGIAVVLWLADEGHKTESSQMLAASAAFAAKSALAVTATPFRALTTEDLSLWSHKVYEYSAKMAFDDGVIVRPEVVQWRGDDTPLDDACCSMIANVIQHGPGLANAKSIADADYFVSRLARHGISAAPIHSGMSQFAQADAIAELKSGSIQCLVHVNMLSEGVDLPWLRWLCMRRAVKSRVRFCQEVGRVIRAAPGKTKAYLLDPLDLFDSFGLTYEAMLEGTRKPKFVNEEDELANEILRNPPSDKERWIKALADVRRYVRRLYLGFLAAGAIEQLIKSTGWRLNDPSEKQIGAVRYAVAGLIKDTAVPMVHRKTIAFIGEHADKLKRGDVSDMLTIGFCLRDRRKTKQPWPLDEAENE